MPAKRIKEGKIELFTPPIKKTVRKSDTVFYNPEMEFSRDISVSALTAFLKTQKLTTGCDCLAATGVRGLRYGKECKLPMTLNDLNPSATRLIKKNIKHNKLKNCKVTKKDASLLLRENTFGFIDIDPFGSPANFLDSAARSIWHKGLLAVTATDTAPLSGTYPSKCLRRYGIKSFKSPFYSELGLRILLTYIILTLSRYDKAFTPLLSHATRHYFRIFGKIQHQGKIAPLLKQFGYVMFCKKCGRHSTGKLKLTCKCKNNFIYSGPIYLGPIQDKKFVTSVKKDIAKRKFPKWEQEMKLLKTIEKEIDTPFYYDLHFLAKKKLLKLQKTDKIISKLKKRGFHVSRTHFCPTAIKTNKEY